jgi:hypothetical protein
MHRLAALVLTILLPHPAAAGARGAPWVRPVPGPVSRGFSVGTDPYAGGQHRGADLAAAPDARVVAACPGRVEVAGRVGSSGRVVTVRCGRWRVSYLPLGAIAVRRGARVSAGDTVGRLAASDPDGSHHHAGLHLGVRREGRRFGYVDPLRLLGAALRAPPLLGVRTRGRGTRPRPPRARAPAPAVRSGSANRSVSADRSGSSPLEATDAASVAPWPAWLGLALVLAGAAGAGAGRARRRYGRSSAHRPVWRQPCHPWSTSSSSSRRGTEA